MLSRQTRQSDKHKPVKSRQDYINAALLKEFVDKLSIARLVDYQMAINAIDVFLPFAINEKNSEVERLKKMASCDAFEQVAFSLKDLVFPNAILMTTSGSRVCSAHLRCDVSFDGVYEVNTYNGLAFAIISTMASALMSVCDRPL